MNKIVISTFLFVSTTAFAASIELVAPVEGSEVLIHKPGQVSFVQMPHDARIAFFADQKKRNEMQAVGWYPQPVKLEWKGGAAGTVYEVAVNRVPDGKSFFVWTGTNMSVEVDNLEIARTYAWTVTADGKTSRGTFKTDDIAPRFLRVEGAMNMRDLGGRLGLDGRRVRQGMIYRTAGLNSNASMGYYTKEELVAAGKWEAIEAAKRAVEEQIKMWKAATENPSSFKVVNCPFGKEWTVTHADGKTESATYKHGQITLTGTVGPKEDVTLTHTFTAPEDGVFLASLTRSQLASIRMNGNLVHDLKSLPDSKHPTKDDALVAIPVKKGENAIAVVVNPAGRVRVWRCSPTPKEPLSKALASMLHNAELRNKYVDRVPKGMIPGVTRLNDASRAYLTQTLGIRSDIDLRSDRETFGMTGSPMGPEVTWFHISSSAYGGMQTDFGKAAFKKVFAVFLDEKNYPIDFHCIAGQDRTGAVAYILNGLLGVDAEQLSLDWEVTGFWNKSAKFNHKNLYNGLVKGFEQWPGTSLREKIEAYVLSLGFTSADISRFREIMLEK